MLLQHFMCVAVSQLTGKGLGMVLLHVVHSIFIKYCYLIGTDAQPFLGITARCSHIVAAETITPSGMFMNYRCRHRLSTASAGPAQAMHSPPSVLCTCNAPMLGKC